MMALPSTPTASTRISSTSRLGNLFRKIRTPSPEQARGPLAALNNAFSTPGGPRRSPSRTSSFATTNSSTTSVNSMSPSVLEMPQFEAGDWLNSDWTPAELSDSNVPLSRNPYSSNLPASTTTSLASITSSLHSAAADENTLAQSARPSSSLSRHSPPPRAGPAGSLSRTTGGSASGSSYYASTGSGSGSSAGGQASGVDSSGDKVRGGKASFLSRSVNGGEGGIKTLTKGWAKSSEFLGRSGGAEKRGGMLGDELEQGAGADEMGVKKVADDFKSPPSLPGYNSLSSRGTFGTRLPSSDRAFSSSQPAPTSSSSSSSNDITPAVARSGLSKTTASLRMKRLQERGGDSALLPRPRRAQRVLIADLEKQEDEGNEGGSELSSAEQNRTLPSSPGMHGRSRSDLVLASPKLDRIERTAATVTLPLEQPSMSSASYMRRYEERTASAAEPSSTRPASAGGNYASSRDGNSSANSSPPNTLEVNGKSNLRTHFPLKPQSSAVLRQRLLQSSSTLDTSPPIAPPLQRYPSSEDTTAVSRAASLEQRRSQVVEETAARLAESVSRGSMEERRFSPKTLQLGRVRENSVERSSPEEDQRARMGLQRSNSGRGEREETMVARPGSSTAVYRDGSMETNGDRSGSTTLRQGKPTSSSSYARPPSSFEPVPEQREYLAQAPPPRPSSQQSYHAPQDENDYQPRNANVPFPRQPQHHQQQPSHSSAPSYAPSYSQQPSSRPILGESYRGSNPTSTQQQRGPTSYPKERVGGDYHVPLREGSPGMAEATPSMTHQQSHYTGSAAQYRQPMQQQQMQPVQHEIVVPVKAPKKQPTVIVVNGRQYHKAGMLGKGGSSRVYRVLDEKNQLFAIKKVDISKNDAETRASFINEIHLLEKLRGNPQIIKLVDSEMNESRRTLLMVMEVGETDLNNLLIDHSGKAISMNFIRYIWEQMLEAVQVIHNENVVHTDLKPANFVLVKGRLKLIDFGISKAIANDTTNIGRDQQIGTANYMPPEALIDSGMGQGGKRLMKLGRAADVWSLGCILYQMVYGRTPFAHLRDVGQKIMAIQNPRYVMSFPTVACPVDERGEEKKDCAVRIEKDLVDAMRSCLLFDHKKRATIPELMEGAFLRGDGMKSPPVDQPLSSTDQDTMFALIQRIKRIPEEQLMGDAGMKTAGKLMMELRAA